MEANTLNAQRERLLDGPCWVVDFLPRQVPAEAGEHYFAVEAYLAKSEFHGDLRRRFARLLLKMNCYAALFMSRSYADTWSKPAPEVLAEAVESGAECLQLLFPEEDAFLAFDPDDLYLTLYCREGDFLELAGQIASAEGLFLRRGAGEETP